MSDRIDNLDSQRLEGDFSPETLKFAQDMQDLAVVGLYHPNPRIRNAADQNLRRMGEGRGYLSNGQGGNISLDSRWGANQTLSKKNLERYKYGGRDPKAYEEWLKSGKSEGIIVLKPSIEFIGDNDNPHVMVGELGSQVHIIIEGEIVLDSDVDLEVIHTVGLLTNNRMLNSAAPVLKR